MQIVVCSVKRLRCVQCSHEFDVLFCCKCCAVSYVVSEQAKVVNAADVKESIKSGGLAAIKTERIKVRLPQIRTVHQDARKECFSKLFVCVSRK